ncbi:phage holin family protein [Micromonospora sp. NBC_01638]|uniref:phage holin family protein n=1 Tax=Micromonospora sp. NBC_01638 TaxID=2975982 RepID=UPI003869E087|nr:phage holin family protein [Micromonospora sp. NBC_01638]
MSEGTTGPDGRRTSATERLAEDVADVVREEVRAVRMQVGEAARPAGLGIVLLAAAGGCLVLGAGAASTTVLRVLETMLPRRLAAAGLTAGYLGAAVLLGRVGMAQLRAAGGPSARLADDVRDMVTETAGRVLPAGVDAARAELDR